MVKLGSSGNLQWQTVLGGSKDDEAYSIRQTSDEGYIFAGVTNATLTNDNNLADHPFSGGRAWVVKLDSTGNVTWQKTYGGNSDDIASGIAQTSDGGYIFAGTTYSDDSGDVGHNHGYTDIWVVKLDSTGTIQWTKLLGGNNWDFTSPCFDDSIQQTTDRGYVVIGTTSSNFNGDVGLNHGSGDAWIIKLDNTGNISWQYPFGGNNMDWGTGIRQTPDNGYVFAGTTYSSNSDDVSQGYGNGDYWVGKLDSEGNLQWQQPLGGSDIEQAESILPTSDGSYLVAGRSYSSNNGMVAEQNHGDADAWIVKLTPRFVVNVKDLDTDAFIPGANVGLYDPQNNTWMNQTSRDGPVVFNGSVGSNPFVFKDGTVFGLSVSAEGYPSVSENVKFQVTNQTVNVILTSYNRPTIGQTYSMTMIQNPGPVLPLIGEIGNGDLRYYGTNIHAVVQNRLESDEEWTNSFYHTEDQVTKEDFGTDYHGLDDSTFFYHFGHGNRIFGEYGGSSFNETYIPLSGYSILDYIVPGEYYDDIVTPGDVYKKWGGKNKWVFLDACHLLEDKRWGAALNTTHGILGYSSWKGPNEDLPKEFFNKSLAYNETIVQSYYQATITAQAGPTAAMIFATPNQFYHDHMPGHGTIAADESPDNNVVYYVEWCAKGRCDQ